MNLEKTFFNAQLNAGAQTQTNTFWHKHLTTAHYNHTWMMQKPRQIMTANGVASVRLWQTHPVDFPRGHIAPKWHNEAHWAQWRKMTIHDLSPRFSTGIESLTPPKLYRELKLFVDAFKKLDLWAGICNLNVESIMIFTTQLAANNFWDTLTISNPYPNAMHCYAVTCRQVQRTKSRRGSSVLLSAKLLCYPWARSFNARLDVRSGVGIGNPMRNMPNCMRFNHI